jgi:hypothetical protein
MTVDNKNPSKSRKSTYARKCIEHDKSRTEYQIILKAVKTEETELELTETLFF